MHSNLNRLQHELHSSAEALMNRAFPGSHAASPRPLGISRHPSPEPASYKAFRAGRLEMPDRQGLAASGINYRAEKVINHWPERRAAYVPEGFPKCAQALPQPAPQLRAPVKLNERPCRVTAAPSLPAFLAIEPVPYRNWHPPSYPSAEARVFWAFPATHAGNPRPLGISRQPLLEPASYKAFRVGRLETPDRQGLTASSRRNKLSDREAAVGFTAARYRIAPAHSSARPEGRPACR